MAHTENHTNHSAQPPFFRSLILRGCLTEDEIVHTADGFYAAVRSLADILIGQEIATFPNAQDQERSCDKFYDDWYLYAVPHGAGHVYGLMKMREQESDASGSVPADGDTPGVTVSFISFQTEAMAACLADPTPANRKALNAQIDRVVAARGQRHHPALKAYFIRPEAEGPYLIAELYVRFIAALAQHGSIAVPGKYAALFRRSRSPKASRKSRRLPDFLDANNEAAGYPVCDHERIFFRDSRCLSLYEKQAILATHTGNVCFHSFAAEVRYHARFLVWYARLPLPVIGRSVYASAVRADMTIDDTEFEGPAPFYHLDSHWVQLQRKYHPEYR